MEPDKQKMVRNIVSFWFFGLCNNFGYVMMLSAAQDILTKNSNNGTVSKIDEVEDVCLNSTETRYCPEVSTGVVLLCNILPGLIVKLLAPFYQQRLKYGFRQAIICISIITSFLVTAFSESVSIALFGVMLTSFSLGLGECTFLALTSHFPSYSISAWSSGAGAAGVFGAFVYAAMTDARLLNLSSSTTILISLIVPVIFIIMYYIVLIPPPTVQPASFFQPKSWFNLVERGDEEQGVEDDEKSAKHHHTTSEKIKIINKLWIYMVPIGLVYYAEYFINQGLVELTVFDCDHGFSTSPQSQYRWYQVLYQIGVFISCSSSDIVQLSMAFLLLLPVLQITNAIIFLSNALHPFLPNFAVACCIVVFEGLIGGASFVNSFRHLHNNIDKSSREFALGICSVADCVGILFAASTSIPAHNAICQSSYL